MKSVSGPQESKDMNDVEQIRRRIQESHPRAVPEFIRHVIGETGGGWPNSSTTSQLCARPGGLRAAGWANTQDRTRSPS